MARRRALLLINDRSRRGAEAGAQARECLGAAGFELVGDPALGRNPAHYVQAIRDHARRSDLVVVGGGDGSANAAIEGILDTGLPLGIIPLGTANNLARTLGIEPTIEGACRALTTGDPRKIDLGWVNGRYFFNLSGLGLSTQIHRGIPAESKRKWGALAYVAYGLKLARRISPFHAQIRMVEPGSAKARVLRTRARQIIVCNGRHYGSGLTIAEDAAIDDGLLDVCCVEATTFWQGASLFKAMRKGNYREEHAATLLRGTEFEIRTRLPMVVDTDGDITTRTPARFRVIPKALTVIAPKREAASAGLTSAPGRLLSCSSDDTARS